MLPSEDLYTLYYDEKSLDARLDKDLDLKPARTISIFTANQSRSLPPSGPPQYDPAGMPDRIREQHQLEPLYVPPLAYYAIRAMHPWYSAISPVETLVSSEVSVVEKDGSKERANIVDVVAPWAKENMDYVDPATWAILIQNFHGLPARCFKYTLALNDPHLTTLSTISPTPDFSVVTFLDLSGSYDLTDSTISLLKGLSSLCVFDSSGTGITDQGLKNLKSTLALREPGPLYLRSWSLRGCSGVTSKGLISLAAFPMLCIVDLRGSSVGITHALDVLWLDSTYLPSSSHPELFAPHPQHRVPALLQALRSSAFLHSTNDSNAQEPYVIHVDRQRPKAIGRFPRSSGNPVSRLGANAYYVDSRYQPPSPEPERRSMEYSRGVQRDYYGGCGDEYENGYGYEDEDEYDPHDPWDPDEDHERPEFRPHDEGSFESLEETNSQLSADQDRSSSSPVFLPRFESLSPSPPIPEDVPSPQEPIVPHLGEHEEPSYSSPQDPSTTAPSTAANSPSPSSASERSMSIITVSDSNSDDDLFPGTSFEPLVQAQAASQFYNPRAQAGLAPPQKRRRTYSPNHSEDYDSEEERKLDLQVLGDPRLMLLRDPPPWRAIEILSALQRKPVYLSKTKPEGQGGVADPKPPLAHLAKKRKTGMGGAMGIWNQIKAASKAPLQPTGGPISAPTPSQASTTSTRPTLGGRPLVPPKAELLQKQDDKPVRRTTLGRAPRPPGTIVRKK
ncbi:hypothetical protein BDV93DRAFT_212994 [Ceratobasidium sp. AG-I]|nr:hypothetical protein BDV93DRAFT_212994 [Ceratobasidium sp. AG-I]